MTVLLLRLAGPLQAWGSAARFARRTTENAPTKSGVLGLLAAAEGRPRGADLADLAALRFGVRVDQPGSRLRDFHTAHHGDSGKAMPLSERFYLADAVFVAGVEGDSALLDRLYEAVRAPRFLPYLGRRSCPPSRPLDLGRPFSGPCLEDALRAAPWQAASWYRKRIGQAAQAYGQTGYGGPDPNGPPPPVAVDLLLDCPPGELPHLSLRDTPVSFDPRHRQYGVRDVVTSLTDPRPHSPDGAPAAEHDPTVLLRTLDPTASTSTAEHRPRNR
ncbi:type I-E CRISPR-associated protein Cas5/CasD [Streptomyces murinus]|uniref:CRISPR system Cascade subunit CasD n=1 Tax=Streptomyces murinus TaxID=33900 RepID=A0A7W3NMI1_STRMR|nr:type I-E CRISPR-associated protein Cas5/CasD [Streptomyces murinus]MBA9053182.1 CRISPR system Cascade subunit CasD [Streptomyces murinus]UWW94341.1 type I-E CRISPR-associated protein Cas5/CasD [Streptomyces murinus]